MRRVMEELDIPSPELHSGAVWAAVISLVYCSISLNELIRRAKISRKKRTNFSAKMDFSKLLIALPRLKRNLAFTIWHNSRPKHEQGDLDARLELGISVSARCLLEIAQVHARSYI